MSTYGVIDNLTYTYNGNQLTKVTDAANGPNYTEAFHFVDGSNATTEYEYDQNGNMTKDLNKKISRIQYNLLNLPSTIKIMNATGTYFINKTYDATGQLLRVRYQFGTAGTGPLGSIGDSFPDGGNEPQGGGLVGPIQPPVFDDGRKDYCGNIIYENNALSQILFDGGYITLSGTTPTYHYYLQDYLGNNRVVVKQDGTVEQVNHYYPFGSIIPDICSDQDIQPYKYNGKEFDGMHGLNTYDYGARQYNPVTAHWDRVDPLCEKYYNISPYVYCHNNPVMLVDPDGRDDYYTSDGTYIGTNSAKTDYIYISNDYRKLEDGRYLINVDTRVGLPVSNISAKALSKIFTHIVGRMPEVDLNQLDGKQINVVKWSPDAYGNGIHFDEQYGNCQDGNNNTNASTLGNNITAFWGDNGEMFETRSNIQNMLGAEEYTCHFKNQWSHFLKGSKIPNKKDNVRIFNYVMNHPTWNKTTDTYKQLMIKYKNFFLGQ